MQLRYSKDEDGRSIRGPMGQWRASPSLEHDRLEMEERKSVVEGGDAALGAGEEKETAAIGARAGVGRSAFEHAPGRH